MAAESMGVTVLNDGNDDYHSPTQMSLLHREEISSSLYNPCSVILRLLGYGPG